jgi:hypothetical protein
MLTVRLTEEQHERLLGRLVAERGGSLEALKRCTNPDARAIFEQGLEDTEAFIKALREAIHG